MEFKHPDELLQLAELESVIKDYVIKSDDIINVNFDESRYNIRQEDKDSLLLNPNEIANSLLKVKVNIQVNGIKFNGEMDRVFIHSIGGKIWPEISNNYYNVLINWIDEYYNQKSLLIQQVIEVLRTKKKIIRYFPEHKNEIYGYVTEKYKPTSQLQFRENLIKLATESGKFSFKNIFSEPKAIEFGNGIKVEEVFSFEGNKDSKAFINCHLTYGLNNGYGSYKVKWLRKSHDKAWMSDWVSDDRYEWRNNSLSELDDFVNYLIKEGEQFQEFLDKRITLASNSSVQQDFLDHFLDKMVIAYATKDKIKNQFRISCKEYGKTVWAISSSIRFIATFDNYTPLQTKWLLRDTGTLMIDKEYEEFLHKVKSIKLEGDFESTKQSYLFK